MTTKQVKFAAAALLLACPCIADAQFNTLRKREPTGYELLQTKGKETLSSVNQSVDTIPDIPMPLDAALTDKYAQTPPEHQKRPLRKKHLGFERTDTAGSENLFSYYPTDYQSLPKLTITNLLEEIRRNGILHEKIVLAQAILETGWFTSSVCRNKNNLFGLTNPRTGQYYEFSHWTESVRAYYDKVQYRYKGGNYLLWLREIGYAEDPRYVSSLIRILRQYMI